MIRLELPWVPPSSNKAYFNLPHGRTLSTEGKKFKRETSAHLAQKYPQQLVFFKPNTPYLIALRFFFEDVETKGFSKGKAKNRFQTFDGGNRLKLLEDVLKDVGGIDDSQTMTSIWEKKQGLPERTVIWAWDLEKEASPFDGVLASLT
jgi:hypothetical protein